MFQGISVHVLDEKSRLTMPRRFHEEIERAVGQGKEFVLTHGLDGGLIFTDRGTLQAVMRELGDGVAATRTVRAARRLILGGAEDSSPDRSGRLVLSEALRASAEIKRAVYLVGVGNVIEIWAEELWLPAHKAAVGAASLLFDADKAVGPTVGTSSPS